MLGLRAQIRSPWRRVQAHQRLNGQHARTGIHVPDRVGGTDRRTDERALDFPAVAVRKRGHVSDLPGRPSVIGNLVYWRVERLPVRLRAHRGGNGPREACEAAHELRTKEIDVVRVPVVH